MADAMAAILETTQAERLATGFVFTEGPLWHPDGFYYFVDMRASMLYRIAPGRPPRWCGRRPAAATAPPSTCRAGSILCEGDNRRVMRQAADGRFEVLVDRFEGKRLNRPNDVVCKSDGSLYFTDPGLRVPLRGAGGGARGRVPHRARRRGEPRGGLRVPERARVLARRALLYVANTRWAQYIHALELDADGRVLRRRIFADMSSDETDGVPDGMKVDVEGRVYCTGPGGTWVFAPDGTRLGIIRTPEVPGQPGLRRPRPAHALLHRAHLGLHAARQGAGPAAPVVPAAGPVTGCQPGGAGRSSSWTTRRTSA